MEYLRIITQDHHRNGIGGAPFNVYLVEDDEGDVKVIVAFADNEHTAVLSLEKLAAYDVGFGSNSWRGDVYRSALNKVLAQDELVAF